MNKDHPVDTSHKAWFIANDRTWASSCHFTETPGDICTEQHAKHIEDPAGKLQIPLVWQKLIENNRSPSGFQRMQGGLQAGAPIRYHAEDEIQNHSIERGFFHKQFLSVTQDQLDNRPAVLEFSVGFAEHLRAEVDPNGFDAPGSRGKSAPVPTPTNSTRSPG